MPKGVYIRKPEHVKHHADMIRGRKLSPEHRAKLCAAHAGVPKSPRHVANQAASQAGRIVSAATRAKLSDAWRDGRKCVPPSSRYTSLARSLHRCLLDRGLFLEVEVKFGRFTVDLYDREHHVAYEADGKYWHDKNELKNPGYYARRDTYLNETFGLAVVHYDDFQIKTMASRVAA